MTDGLNLRMWASGAAGCLLITIMLCVLPHICKLFSQGRVRDQQVASFMGSIAFLTKNKGGNIGDCFTWHGPSSHSEKPVGVKPDTQDPHPRIGSPVGNQACIVSRPLSDLLLLKLPHTELRQQTLTAYL